MANFFAPEREVAGKKLKPGIFFGLEKSVLFISRLIEFVQKVSSKEVRHYFRKFDSSDKELINELAVYGVGYRNAFFSLASDTKFLMKYADFVEEVL